VIGSVYFIVALAPSFSISGVSHMRLCMCINLQGVEGDRIAQAPAPYGGQGAQGSPEEDRPGHHQVLLTHFSCIMYLRVDGL
jgi:hypothetical protein